MVTLDSALRVQPVLREALQELQDRFAYYPGSRQARTVLQLGDGRSESPGESVTRVQFFRYGIPMPEPQYHVINSRGQLVGVSDFGWEEYRHLAEFDGKVKYQKLLRPVRARRTACSGRSVARTRCVPKATPMSRFVWNMIMPDSARRSMAELRRAMDQSRRLNARGRTVIAS